LALGYARRKRFEARVLVTELGQPLGGGAKGEKRKSAAGVLRQMGTRIRAPEAGD